MTSMTSKFPGKCAKCAQPFPAGTVINWEKGRVEHATCPPKPVAVAPVEPVDVSNVVAFLAAATKLKFPKLRVLNVAGEGELTIAPSKKYPGSVFVRDSFLGPLGGVKANGEPFGGVAKDPALQAHLRKVNAAPLAAAKHYAAIKCNCSFCGLPLTDEASTEVGYGPVCAKHYGLPHKAKGTADLKHVDEAPEPEQQVLSPVDELLDEQAQDARAAVAAIGLW